MRLLGGFRVSCAGREVDDGDWRLAKARSLVKLLALEPGHALHREQVIDLLWPEMDPDAAANNLNQALFVARRTLASVVPGVDGASLIARERQMLSLQPPGGLWIDVDAFDRLAATARRSDDPASYYAAIDLYGGELLPEDRYEDWAGERREATRDRYLQILLRLADLHSEREEHAPAIDVLRRLIATDPLNEQAHAGLMRLYALTGRPQQALRQYQRLSELLERELDSEPDPATSRLYRAILDHRFPPPTRRAPPVTTTTAPRQPAQETAEPPAEPARDFVDRASEMDALRGAIEQAISGQGRIVLLAGQPGIGKTRTAAEAVEHARSRGMRVLWGRCHETEGAPAYWPWAQVIRAIVAEEDAGALQAEMGPAAADIARIAPDVRQVLPDLPESPALDPEQERFRLFDGVAGFVKRLAARQPILLVLDDLHWADRSSLSLLEFLAGEIASSPICVIGAYRDEDVSRHHPLSRTLAVLSRQSGVRRLVLAGLGVDDVARYSEVAAGRPPPRGLAVAIHEQTEGNPFFMTEVVRLLIEEGRFEQPDEVHSWRVTIPPGVRETVGLRMDRLSEEANRVLTIAAVAGREFALPVIERVSDITPDQTLSALEEALAAKVLDEIPDEPGSFRFAHILIRQTLYEEVSNARRLQLHRRLAEALETLYGADPDEHLDDLAYHFFLSLPGGDAGKAIDYATRAAVRAMGRVAYAEAAGHLERALQALPRLAVADPARECDLLLLLGEAQRGAGDLLDARMTFTQAADAARALDSPERLARAALGFESAGVYSVVSDTEGVRLLEDALDAIGPADSPLRATLLARLSAALGTFDNDPGALLRRGRLNQEAIEVARRVDDATTLASALVMRLEDLWETGTLPERLSDATEAQRLAEHVGDQQLALTACGWRIHDLLELGQVAAADEAIEDFARLVEGIRQPQSQWSLLNRRTMRLLMAGRFVEAEMVAETAYTIGRRPAPGPAAITRTVQLYSVRRAQGRLDELREAIARIDQATPELPYFGCLLIQLELETDRSDVARERFERIASADFMDIPRNILWIGTVALLAEAAAALNDHIAITRLDSLLEPYDSQHITGVNGIYLGPAAYFRGLLALSSHQLGAARSHLERAKVLSRQVEAWPSLAYASLSLARLAITEGDIPGAVAHLEVAADLARRLGMTRLASDCDRLVASSPGLR
jgi:DNA-binding SARP family transcriptional activator